MKILNKKVYRELFRHNKARSFAIILTLTLTVGFLFGLANSKSVFYDSFDLNMEKLNTPEVRLQFITPIDASNITALENTQAFKDSNIRKIEGRLFFHIQANYKGRNYDALWIALNSTKDQQNDVDKLRIITGNNYFDKENDSLVIFQFGAGLLGHNVQLDDVISIKIENIVLPDLKVAGIVQSNEYTYVVDDRTNIPRLGDMPIIYTSLEWAWNKLNYSTNVINQILVDTNELSEESASKAVSVILPLLASQNAPIYNSITTWETPDYKFFDADAGSIDKFSVVLGGFALIVGIILVYNSLTKLINSQRKHIGLMGAMGAQRRSIMFHYVSLGMILGIIGVIFGIIFSLVLTYLMGVFMLSFYGFNWITISYDLGFFLIGTVITLLAITLFSFLACLPILNITPREAMISTYTRTGIKKRPILERLFKKLPGFKSISTSIPLRETFMNKKRSTLTIIAIAVSSIILIVSGAMIIDMVYGVEKNFTVYNQYDGKVYFENIMPWDDLSTNLSTYEEFDIVEPIFFLPVGVNSKGGTNEFLGYAPIEAVLENSELRHYNVPEGRLPTSSNEVLVGNVIASDWNIAVGDQLNLFVGELFLDVDVTVVGIVGELIDVQIYTYIDIVQESLGLPELYSNGFMFSLAESYDETTFLEIENSIYNGFDVFQFENTNRNFETTQALFEVMIELSALFMLVGVLMVVAFTFNTVYVAYSDREMEYLALRAQGMKRRTLVKIITIETAFFGIIGFILSVPIGYLASFWAIDYILEDNWFIELFIPMEMWIFLFIMTLSSVLLAGLLVARRVNKAKMPDVLRNRQIG